MTDFDASSINTIPQATEPANRSTILDGGGTIASGGGRPALSEGKESIRSALEASLNEAKAEDAKAEVAEEEVKPEKVEKPVKADAKAEVKDDKAETPATKDTKAAAAEDEDEQQPKEREPAKADASERENERQRSSEGRRHQPPARFLTEAKDVWRNTPHAVQREVARMEQDHAQEIERYRTAQAEYERLRPFAERAKQGGTDLHTAMSRYVGMEDAFRSDPSTGFRELLSNLQMTPQQAIVALTRAYGVSPTDLARHIQQAPDQYNALVQQQSRPQPVQQQRQPQADPRVEQLEARLQQMEQQNVAMSIIEPFRQQHPRFDELQDEIAFLLEKGRVPDNLSPIERLHEAYILADRMNPASDDDRSFRPTRTDGLVSDRRVDEPSNGSPSIRSSLGGSNIGDDTDNTKKSLREQLEEELRRTKRRA